MKTKLQFLLVLAILAAAALSGCLQSIHPIYTDETVTFRPEILGKWSGVDSEDYWKFERGDAESRDYLVTVFDDEEEAPSVLHGHLVEVGEDLYLDLTVADVEFQGGSMAALCLLPVHTFVRIGRIGPTLQLAMPDVDEVFDLIEKHPGSLGFAETEDHCVLTASPEDLQEFFTRHRDHEGLFGEYSDLKLVEAPPAPPVKLEGFR